MEPIHIILVVLIVWWFLILFASFPKGEYKYIRVRDAPPLKEGDIFIEPFWIFNKWKSIDRRPEWLKKCQTVAMVISMTPFLPFIIPLAIVVKLVDKSITYIKTK